MKAYDQETLEQIIEQITKQVLILLQDESFDPAAMGKPGEVRKLSAREFVIHVQPVINAGADRVASTLGMVPSDETLGHMIDHTLLKADASHDEIAQLCYEARKFHFATVCVNPTNVALCSDLLKGSDVLVCTVVGFPLGATPTEVKVFETQQSIKDGAAEVDMVINVGALKSRDYETVEEDIAAVARACDAHGAVLKVIIEAALLTDEEKVIACQLAKVAGAGFCKDIHRLRPGGRHPGGRCPHAPGRGTFDRRQSCRWHPHTGRC